MYHYVCIIYCRCYHFTVPVLYSINSSVLFLEQHQATIPSPKASAQAFEPCKRLPIPCNTEWPRQAFL